MAVSIGERLSSISPEEFYRSIFENFSAQLRVSVPGIIHEFDPETQTASVQVAIREKILDPSDLSHQWTEIPLLLDVPIVVPRAGGYVLTMPVQAGDECLVIFSDMCIDAWFSNSGVQNQIEKRRHDLSDAFAIVGAWSQPRRISNYSTTAAQLRTDDGSAFISLGEGEIDIVAPSVKINGISFNAHTHTAPAGGGKTSGPS